MVRPRAEFAASRLTTKKPRYVRGSPIVAIRLTLEERAKLRQLARAENLSVSAYVRRAVFGEAGVA
jgi:hypothetical protein